MLRKCSLSVHYARENNYFNRQLLHVNEQLYQRTYTRTYNKTCKCCFLAYANLFFNWYQHYLYLQTIAQ